MRLGIGLGLFKQGAVSVGVRLFSAYKSRVIADGGTVEADNCGISALNNSLFQQASLLLIPSGYKGGKAYAEIPTNGNGDLTWTRASDAWRTNADGLIQRVPWNILTYSETFTNAIWQKSAATITANTTIAPNGTLTASSLMETTATTIDHYIFNPSIGNWSNSMTYSVYLKQNGRRYVQTATVTSQGVFRPVFDLQDGVYVGNVGTNTGATASITNVGDGWFRCVVMHPTTSLNLSQVTVILQSSATYQSYTGDSTKGVYIWGAQLVEGSSAQTYFPTTDRLNVPRLSYMYGSCPALLLEPQRTNVVLHSGDLSQSVWSKTNYALTNVTAIQGLTATRITKNSTNNGNYAGTGGRNVVNTVGTFAAGVKAFSVLLRKGNTAKVALLINQILVGASISASCEFDFATETFTNVSSGLTATFEKPTTDVYRLILVVNDTGTGTSKALWIAPVDSSNNTVTDGYVDIAYFQWELGAYATTIIPTTTASATRIADSFSRNNIYTNGLITSSGGTWFVELRGNTAYTADTTVGGFFIDSANFGYTNGFLFRKLSSGRIVIQKYIATIGTTLYTTTTDTTKIAIKWNGSTADVFVNGTKQVSGTVFTTTALQFLMGNANDAPRFIQAMALYPTPLSDTDCTTITTL